jgi:hypothetical protein
VRPNILFVIAFTTLAIAGCDRAPAPPGPAGPQGAATVSEWLAETTLGRDDPGQHLRPRAPCLGAAVVDVHAEGPVPARSTLRGNDGRPSRSRFDARYASDLTQTLYSCCQDARRFAMAEMAADRLIRGPYEKRIAEARHSRCRVRLRLARTFPTDGAVELTGVIAKLLHLSWPDVGAVPPHCARRA